MQIDNRVLVLPLPEDDEDQRQGGDRREDHDEVRLKPVFALAFIEHYLKRAKPKSHQSQPDVVDVSFSELAPLEVRRILNQPRGQQDGQNPDRDINEENPAPAEIVGDPPAESGTNRRRGNDRHSINRKRHASLGWRKSIGQYGLFARLQSSAANSLKNPANDQDSQIGCEA